MHGRVHLPACLGVCGNKALHLSLIFFALSTASSSTFPDFWDVTLRTSMSSNVNVFEQMTGKDFLPVVQLAPSAHSRLACASEVLWWSSALRRYTPNQLAGLPPRRAHAACSERPLLSVRASSAARGWQ